jgi:peptidoglycan/LPS O-acetylase OafA/YrhL
MTSTTERVRAPLGPTPEPVGPGGEPERPGGPSLPHVPALDGLRGAAVAAVLVYHDGHLTGGWLGVDLFFVLSGYLITGLLLSAWRRSGGVGLRSFWARRARRLAPALVITLVGVGVYAALVATPLERWGIRGDGLATLFEVANWRNVIESNNYFASTLRPSPLQHTWSLAIEEQLYLLWPLVVAGLLAWRRKPSAVLVASVVGSLVSAGLMIGLHAHGSHVLRVYEGTDTRAVAVLLGAAVASLRVVLGPKRWASTRSARQALGIVGAIGLAGAWARLDGATALPYQGVLPLCSLAGALVVASIADRRHPGPLGEVLSLAPLRWLGLVSYGVYLFHWPIFQWLDASRTHQTGLALFVLRIAVTIGLAALSYRFVEQPIRRRSVLDQRQARAALPAGAALAALAIFAGTLGAVPPPSAAELASQTVVRSSVPGAPLVMFAGDSVPLLLGKQIGDDRDALGISVANLALPGCHLLASVGSIRGIEGDVRNDVTDCASGGIYRTQVRNLHPSVAVVMFGEFPNESVRYRGRWLMACQPEYMRLLRQKLDALIDDLRVGHTPVVLLTAPGSTLSWVVDRVKPGMAERVACSNQQLVDIATQRKGVSVVDLASFVCPPTQTKCLEKVDGADLRPDGLHFTGPGAAYVAQWLVPRILSSIEPG